MKFCEEVNLQVVPSIDITNDVAELDDVLVKIKEYLDLFKGFKYESTVISGTYFVFVRFYSLNLICVCVGKDF